MGIFCGHKLQTKKHKSSFFLICDPFVGQITHMMNGHTLRNNRDCLLKVRVREETKKRVIIAARVLDLDQSELVRLAVQDYLARNCPHAA